MIDDAGEKNVKPEEELAPRGRHFRTEPTPEPEAMPSEAGAEPEPAAEADAAAEPDTAAGAEPVINDEEPAWPTQAPRR